VSAGVRMDYHITHHQMVLLNLGVSHLGSGITNSPLVGKKTIPEAMFGYLYQFN
jgi:outer membrane protein